MIIRQAEEDDAQQIMALFHIILKEMEVPLLKQADDKKLCKALERSFETPECRKTLAQIIVADVSGKVAGIAFGYPNEMSTKSILFYAASFLPLVFKSATACMIRMILSFLTNGILIRWSFRPNTEGAASVRPCLKHCRKLRTKETKPESVLTSTLKIPRLNTFIVI